MCAECVRESAPDRGRMCTDSGCYILNYVGCSECKSRDMPVTVKKLPTKPGETGATSEEDPSDDSNDDDMEETVFWHICGKCDHVIAKHTYTFEVLDNFQEYTMLCRLCGRAADTQSVMPDDPRKKQFF
eukprot:m.54655 g.54655  ORF g.54655 m.54655 type:complete len:129 (+) comp10940_c0_seq2:163-549(+)